MTIKHLKFRNESRNISPNSLLDEEVGKFIEMELEKECNVSLPSNTDWGYTFKIKIKQIIDCYNGKHNSARKNSGEDNRQK